MENKKHNPLPMDRELLDCLYRRLVEYKAYYPGYEVSVTWKELQRVLELAEIGLKESQRIEHATIKWGLNLG